MIRAEIWCLRAVRFGRNCWGCTWRGPWVLIGDLDAETALGLFVDSVGPPC